MESSTAAPPETAPPLEAIEPVSFNGPSSRARQRGAVLARMLYFGDSLAAAAAAALAITIIDHASLAALAYVVGATLLWPFAAFSIGLYRSDQLSTWASAVSEVPRGFVAVLLITWPLYGIATALSLEEIVLLTFVT